MNGKRSHRFVHFAAAGFAIVFGLLTLISGGYVLFGGEKAIQIAGNVVGFVLWFNFLAGVCYVLAGLGLLLRKQWAFWLALAVFLSTAGVFVAFGFHVQQGGAYEMRTVLALTFRTTVWAVLAWLAWKFTRHE